MKKDLTQSTRRITEHTGLLIQEISCFQETPRTPSIKNFYFPPCPPCPPCLRVSLLILLFSLFCSCVSQYKVIVDFSPDIKDYFTEIPTIEVDIAAVTDSEVEEIKQAGVEKYFAPDSGMREKLQSQTCFFYREAQNTFVLPSRAPIWQSWLLKQPTNVLVIASLPHDPSMTPQADPRYVTIKMARSYVLARTINILVEPKKVIRLARAYSKNKNNKAAPAAEQWVEAR